MSRVEFLDRFGHRGPNEMELAAPRWAEDPAAVDRLAAAGAVPSPPTSTSEETVTRVAAEAKLTGPTTTAFRTQVGHLRTYLGLRETAKHYLLMGYAVVRRLLVELDRRHDLAGGIYYLTPPELRDLSDKAGVLARIAERRKRRQVELSLPVPPVLFSDDLDAIGRPMPVPEGATVFDGLPLSAGVAEGPALVLIEPTASPPVAAGFVLVCPSTDPAWVPLFARAAAVVMETGGVLSHGAIVAREFGLPAVAGLPGITRRITTGQRVRVDSTTGRVTLIES
jgi:pyruvate,water dikinase